MNDLHFTTAVITGGAGGIGKAIAEYFIAKGKKVIIVGRTEKTLAKTATEIGAIAHYVLDVGQPSTIPAFITKLLSEHPEVDCLVNNAGVQRPLEVLKMDPKEFLEKADNEVDINIRGPVHLTLGLLEHFKTKKESLVVNVSSVLAFVPFSVINPIYNGTKAFLHMWSTNLRTQLKGTSVKVVEIAPPTVETNLHREREDPDDNKKAANSAALSTAEFMDEIKGPLESGEVTIGAGVSKGIVAKWDEVFGAQYKKRIGE